MVSGCSTIASSQTGIRISSSTRSSSVRTRCLEGAWTLTYRKGSRGAAVRNSRTSGSSGSEMTLDTDAASALAHRPRSDSI
jgi:hypothetical protein